MCNKDKQQIAKKRVTKPREKDKEKTEVDSVVTETAELLEKQSLKGSEPESKGRSDRCNDKAAPARV